MKRVIFLMIVILLGALYLNYNDSSVSLKNKDDMMKAVFISYIDYSSLKGKEVMEQKNIINEMVNNVSYFGFNTVVLQVRSFGDAIYDSFYFPESICVSYDKDGKAFDILSYFISVCESKNIELYAWVNPYRISNNNDVSKVNKSASYYKWLNTSLIGVYDNGIYFNPAQEDVKNLIVSGVVEIAKNYRVKGILFDDYFYPDYDIDLKNYQDYINSGGDLSHEDYKYSVILNMIKNVYSTIKSVNSNIKFGISPEGNIENNYNKHYLDVKKILSSEGYVDYIMPQIYFGFLNEVKPFIETLNEWDNLIKVDSIKLIPALAFYKTGRVDKYAKSGENEWINNSDIIKRQIEEIRKIKKYDGFSLFRYDYLFDNEKYSSTSLDEYNNLISILD